MFRVKFDKSDWFWSQSIVFTKPFKNGMSLDQARGRDNLVPRAFSSTIFKMADRRLPEKGWVTWYKISKKSWRFLSRDILRKAKTKLRRSIVWEAKHRSKNALTLYTRQWWLRSKIKYYFKGCFDSGAGLFSICKFIPLSHSLYL